MRRYAEGFPHRQQPQSALKNGKIVQITNKPVNRVAAFKKCSIYHQTLEIDFVAFTPLGRREYIIRVIHDCYKARSKD